MKEPIIIGRKIANTGYIFQFNLIYDFNSTLRIDNSGQHNDFYVSNHSIGSLRQLPDRKMIITKDHNVGTDVQFKAGFVHDNYWYLFSETKAYIICPGIEVIGKSAFYY